jgi:hypothetical protein
MFTHDNIMVIMTVMNKYSPQPGNALVRLILDYGAIKVPTKSYDSIMRGKIIAINEDDTDNYIHIVGKIGHWRQFKDDLRLPENHAFIELKDILGTSEE